MSPPTTCWVPAQSSPRQLSVNYHLQVGCLFQVSKVTFPKDSSRNMAIWLSLAQLWIKARKKLSVLKQAHMSFPLISLQSCFKQANALIHLNLNHIQTALKQRNQSFLA